jgi:hypothetical protein
VAAAAPKLPPGAGAPPDLPPGVVVAENPKLSANVGQGGGDLVASAARSGSRRSDSREDRHPFWATVNVCDTEDSPNALGVRTSVPGNGTNQRIWARYTAQWWSSAEQKWLTVEGSGVTDWILLGTADMSTRQAGWTFRFVQPPAGATYVMRGVVELQWRDPTRATRRAQRLRTRRAHRTSRARRAQRAAVVRERTLLTKTGMKHVQGGDPAGLSKAMCLIW